MLKRMMGRTAKLLLKPLDLEARRTPPLPPEAPEIPENLLEDCRVLPSREHLLAVLPQGGNVAEIGVADGDFSESILQINKPQKLVLVDAWSTERYYSGFDRVSNRFANQITAGTVQIERGNSLDAMKRLPPLSFNWVYIDTVHDYLTTKAELQIAADLVVPGGHIAGHDFCVGNPQIMAFYGVIQAVSEFSIERNLRFSYITLSPNGHFSFCLSR